MDDISRISGIEFVLGRGQTAILPKTDVEHPLALCCTDAVTEGKELSDRIAWAYSPFQSGPHLG
jgi:hypothetical protein